MRKFDNKILLVDDDAKNLQVAMSILKDYNVIYAQSGKRALELINEYDFDLILLDIVMPILNGYEVCKNLKLNDKTKNIPIIFLTVKDDESDIVKGFDEGAVDYITKPFYSSVLLKRVELHLNLSKAISDLKDINTNLNDIVKDQVEDIRKKEQILFQQSKISAMSDMIDVISLKWKQPLSMIKLYMQSLDISIEDKEIKETLHKSLDEVNKLDDTMYDFQKFFKNDIQKQDVNIKVLIDNVIFLLKDDIIKENIDIYIDGDNLIKLFIVHDELRHILVKLISYSLDNISHRSNNEKICLKFHIEESPNQVLIKYKDNICSKNKKLSSKLFNLNTSIKNDSFDLGFYLMNVFIEKNQGTLSLLDCGDGMDLSICFSK